jgi:phospholipid/cholesterol/gamma-HCH transport system substrate-binding protein
MSPRIGKGRTRDRFTRFQAGLIGIILLLALCYGVYTKFANPFASKFTISAQFESANGLNIGSPVRIAGVNVGKVESVSAIGGPYGHGKQAADVTMEIDSAAQPIFRNATFDIRPRIFLEGNFFVDIHPGTPQAPAVPSGYVFPVAAGTEPVQLDQLLSSLQANTRQSLQTLIQQYGEAVKIGGPSYNASIQYWLPAYKYSSIVAHDFQGEEPSDIPNFIAKGADVSAAFDRYPAALRNLITDLDTTASAFASQRAALGEAVAELPVTLGAAIPAFHALNTALPKFSHLAVALEPGVVSAGPAIDASLPFVTQLKDLVQPNELGEVAKELRGTVPALAKLTAASIPLFKNGVRPASACIVNEVYPWSQLTLNDGIFSGTPGFPLRKVFQEGVDYLPGLGGESRNFDANGPYIRVLLSGGSLTYSLSPGMFGQSLEAIDSTQPQEPAGGKEPPLEANVPCDTQKTITNLTAKPGAPIQAVQSNLRAPGATLRWADAVEAALGQMDMTASQQGIKFAVSGALKRDLTMLTKDLKVR